MNHPISTPASLIPEEKGVLPGYRKCKICYGLPIPGGGARRHHSYHVSSAQHSTIGIGKLRIDPNRLTKPIAPKLTENQHISRIKNRTHSGVGAPVSENLMMQDSRHPDNYLRSERKITRPGANEQKSNTQRINSAKWRHQPPASSPISGGNSHHLPPDGAGTYSVH